MTTSPISIDLPWPPSANRLWRSKGKGVYRDPKYIRWINAAGWVAKAAKYQKIEGGFAAIIILNPPDKRRIDSDNRVKALLDLAQRIGLVENDRFCRIHLVCYGQKDLLDVGVRLILIPVDNSLAISSSRTLPGLLQYLVSQV